MLRELFVASNIWNGRYVQQQFLRGVVSFHPAFPFPFPFPRPSFLSLLCVAVAGWDRDKRCAAAPLGYRACRLHPQAPRGSRGRLNPNPNPYPYNYCCACLGRSFLTSPGEKIRSMEPCPCCGDSVFSESLRALLQQATCGTVVLQHAPPFHSLAHSPRS